MRAAEARAAEESSTRHHRRNAQSGLALPCLLPSGPSQRAPPPGSQISTMPTHPHLHIYISLVYLNNINISLLLHI